MRSLSVVGLGLGLFVPRIMPSLPEGSGVRDRPPRGNTYCLFLSSVFSRFQFNSNWNDYDCTGLVEETLCKPLEAVVKHGLAKLEYKKRAAANWSNVCGRTCASYN